MRSAWRSSGPGHGRATRRRAVHPTRTDATPRGDRAACIVPGRLALGGGIEAPHDQDGTQARAHAAHLACPVRSAGAPPDPGHGQATRLKESGRPHRDGCHDQERPGRVHRAWSAGAGGWHRGPTTRTKTPQAGENLSPLSPHDFGLSPHPCGDKITYVNQWLRWCFSVCPHCPHKKKGETRARAAILSGSPPL